MQTEQTLLSRVFTTRGCVGDRVCDLNSSHWVRRRPDGALIYRGYETIHLLYYSNISLV